MLVLETLGWVAIVLSGYFIVQPLMKSPEHFQSEEGYILYFFYTPWCGWSKKAWPHWNELKRLNENRKVSYGGHTISLVEVDADKDKELANAYHVKGYPSFRLRTPDQVFEYSGAPSVEKFREFFKRTLGYELVE